MDYLYSIINDFPSGVVEVNVDNLIYSISLLEFTISFVEITVHGDECKITFESELSSEEKSDLDSVISSHNNTEYDLGVNCPCEQIMFANYNYLGGHKEEIINDLGFLVDVNIYRNRDEEGNLSGLVVNDHYDYTVDEQDLVIYRTEIITWYKTDDAIYGQKSWQKYYDLADSIREGIKRRSNLIEKAKTYLLTNVEGMYEISGQPTMLNSYYLYTLCSNEIELYIAGMKDYLVIFFENTEESYVTEEIRSGVLNIIDYWSE